MARLKVPAGVGRSMTVDDAVLRSARNAFLAVMLAAVGVGVYQFLTAGTIPPGTAVIWLVGAAVFYASKYHYGD
jgi:uncharacterized membrane protein YccC